MKTTSGTKKILKIILLGLVCLALVVPLTYAAAQSFGSISGELDKVANRGEVNLKGKPLAEIIGYVIYGVLGLLGVVCLLVIIYAGMVWILAEGSAEKIQEAKNILRGALIGLVVISLSYAITYYVTSRILGASERGSIETGVRPGAGSLPGGPQGSFRGGSDTIIECSGFLGECDWLSCGPGESAVCVS